MTGNEYNDKANLNHEYMIVYQDMLRYLSSKDISLLVARDIRDDILAMALESQTRGLKVEEAFLLDDFKAVFPTWYRIHPVSDTVCDRERPVSFLQSGI